VNLGDSYAGSGKGGNPEGSPWSGYVGEYAREQAAKAAPPIVPLGLKPKDLIGIPWRVAFALQADGWWLRSEIIWHKPSPMPESVTDRPTKAHEQLFLLAKSPRYFFDAEAIREPQTLLANGRLSAGMSPRTSFKSESEESRAGLASVWRSGVERDLGGRQKRSVWTIPSAPFSDWGYDFSAADYVDDRGIPRKWSPDCPAHARDGRPRQSSLGVAACDESESSSLTDSARSDADRERARPVAADATSHCRNSLAEDSPSDALRLGNGLNRMPAHERETEAVQRRVSTIDTPARCDPSTKDSAIRACAPIARDRSSDDRRSDHAGQTLSDDTVSEQSASRIASTAPQLCMSELDASTDASNTTPCSDRQKSSAETVGDSIDTSSPIHAKCLCAVSQLSHFATFPPALVEPCVQAGTSARGACPACGAPWRRETSRGAESPDVADSEIDRFGTGQAGVHRKIGGQYQHWLDEHPITTLGWAPTCACAPTPVPCVVLDPFAGAGTVGLVADRLGRDAILIELKPEYAAMAERRIREEAPLLTAVEIEGETVEPPPIEPGGKALTTPRGAHEGARWNQNQGRGLPRADGQPWGRAAPAASDNGHGAIEPEQLVLLDP
jgi:hypothetical protein